MIVPPSNEVLHILGNLCRTLPDNPIIVDIGTNRGVTAALMLKNVADRNGVVFTIDQYRGNDTDGYDGLRDPTRLVEFFMAPENNTDKIILMVANSAKAARAFANESVDLVFVDGDHRYSHAIQDLEAWWPKVKPGGIICGDDFEKREYNEETIEQDFDLPACIHSGVIKAVLEMFPGAKHEEGSSFWMQRKSLPVSPLMI